MSQPSLFVCPWAMEGENGLPASPPPSSVMAHTASPSSCEGREACLSLSMPGASRGQAACAQPLGRSPRAPLRPRAVTAESAPSVTLHTSAEWVTADKSKDKSWQGRKNIRKNVFSTLVISPK